MDFNSFGVDTSFDAEDVLNSQGGLLPDMTGAVLGIVSYEDKSNASGWQAVSFELQVLNDGATGAHNGKTGKYQITLANPSFPDSAAWGFDELKRWAAACGLAKLDNAQSFVGRSFMGNVGKKPQKNDPSNFNQTIKQVKRVETAQVAQPTQAAQQPAQGGGFGGQQPAQPSGFGGQAGGFGGAKPFGQ